MDFSYSEEEIKLREDVRQFLKGLTKEELRELQDWSFLVRGAPEKRTNVHLEFARKLGQKGWICPSWPREYGGLGGTFLMDLIVSEELAEQDIGVPNFTAATMCGPTILRSGTPEQKAEFLPRIARGEIEFSLLYTESEAGSDLASLRSSAIEDGDCYILNGEKLYCDTAHYAEFHWFMARTDPQAPKHRGLSIFAIDAKTPGIMVSPMMTMANQRINVVFYENVKVPKNNLIGEKNQGWKYVTLALNYERISIKVGEFMPYFRNLIKFVETTKVNGIPLAADPLIRQKIAQLRIELEICYLLRQKATWVVSRGEVPYRESSVFKLFTSEYAQHFANVIMQIAGIQGLLKDGPQLPPSLSKFSTFYLASLMLTVGGGASELVRDVIAMRGLGLPRV